MNRFYNPVHTVQGSGCFALLPEILDGMKTAGPDGQKVLIIAWDESALRHPAVRVTEKSQPEVQTMVFAASNPTAAQLFEAYRKTEDFAPDTIVAIGGGTTMDIGKSLCCLYGKNIESVDALRGLITSGSLSDEVPRTRWIGVPTTAGTGSEVTCWATIWDPEKNAKRSIENHRNFAYAALDDPELTNSMPLKLAVSSALDAAAHAVESYWARHSNLVSRAAALQAVQIIMGNLDHLLSGEPDAADAMSKGSLLAGLAFSNTKTTACHSISYPLTMHYHIPHGTAVSMLLAPVLRMNLPSLEEPDALLKALGVKDADELEERIRNALEKSGQPSTLRGWGADRDDFRLLASQGITKGRADNNPVELTPEKIEEILETIY